MEGTTPPPSQGQASNGSRSGPSRYQAQRTLIRWNPELEARLLVVYDFVMKQQGYKIPYDIIAQHLDPEKATSGAIEQHISKVRKLHNERCTGPQVPAPSRQKNRGANSVVDPYRVNKRAQPAKGVRHPLPVYGDDFDDEVAVPVGNEPLSGGTFNGGFSGAPVDAFHAQPSNTMMGFTASNGMDHVGQSFSGMPETGYGMVDQDPLAKFPAGAYQPKTYFGGFHPEAGFHGPYGLGRSGYATGGGLSGFGSTSPDGGHSVRPGARDFTGYRNIYRPYSYSMAGAGVSGYLSTPSTASAYKSSSNGQQSSPPSSYEGYQYEGHNPAGPLVPSREGQFDGLGDTSGPVGHANQYKPMMSGVGQEDNGGFMSRLVGDHDNISDSKQFRPAGNMDSHGVGQPAARAPTGPLGRNPGLGLGNNMHRTDDAFETGNSASHMPEADDAAFAQK